jgi:hypothetical protein
VEHIQHLCSAVRIELIRNRTIAAKLLLEKASRIVNTAGVSRKSYTAMELDALKLKLFTPVD